MLLYDKKTLEQVKIYGVSKDKCGHPEVLIREGNRWRYRSMKHYITTEEWVNINRDLDIAACKTFEVGQMIKHNGREYKITSVDYLQGKIGLLSPTSISDVYFLEKASKIKQ